MAPGADRQRLARAIAEFWRDGNGPSHRDIERVLDACDLALEPAGTKYDRIHDAVADCPEEVLPSLLKALFDLLVERHAFDLSLPHHTDPTVVALAGRRLAEFGYRLDTDGTLSGPALDVLAHPALTTLPDLHEHIRRIQVAVTETDSALLLGASKELLESTSKFVLTELGQPIPSDFPQLLSEALRELGLHPKGASGKGDVVEATRRILGGLFQIGVGVNDLRNSYGTGHGKVGVPKLSLRHARLAAGSAAVLAGLMVETFEDPSAPWRKGNGKG